MKLVVHEHKTLSLVHVSTHKDDAKTFSTANYIGRARWAYNNHKVKDSANHNFDDGFQVALLASGLKVNDWEDTVYENVEDHQSKRNQILAEYTSQGYTNVGNTRIKTVRALITNMVGNNGWGKPYSKTKPQMEADFGKVVDILDQQGYTTPEGLFNTIYLANVRPKGHDGLKLNTKGEIVEYIFKEAGFTI